MADFELKLKMLPFVLGMLVITSCVHEAGHAWAAWRLGDRSAQIRRRTNPFSPSHVSLLFTIILPSLMMLFFGLMLGGARPVQVRTALGPRRMALVAAAGPAGNLLVGGLSMALLAGLVHADVLIASLQFDQYYVFALQAVMLNFVLAALNLIPIPPFDGSRIVALLLPDRLRQVYYGFSIPFIVLLALVFLIAYLGFKDEFIAAYTEVLHLVDHGVRALLSLVRHPS